ncbi:hypothetical protein SK128_018805 [Halocaridina rubra]|uniref:Uncharacterized protein n=1 Tax=Halocaridina rubra TaxID=373956 RepID=A0AAN9AAJ3_HALRR
MDFINASDAVLCMAKIPYGILAIHRTASDAFMKSICVRGKPQPPTVVPNHSSNLASKQLKPSVLDGNRSLDLVNAKPARYHKYSCHSQSWVAKSYFRP